MIRAPVAGTLSTFQARFAAFSIASLVISMGTFVPSSCHGASPTNDMLPPNRLWANRTIPPAAPTIPTSDAPSLRRLQLITAPRSWINPSCVRWRVAVMRHGRRRIFFGRKTPARKIGVLARQDPSSCPRASACSSSGERISRALVFTVQILKDPSVSLGGSGRPSRANMAAIAASTASPPKLSFPPLSILCN